MGTFVGFVAAGHALHAALTLGAWLDGVALQAVLLASGLMAAISASVPRCRADVVLDEATGQGHRHSARRGVGSTPSSGDSLTGKNGLLHRQKPALQRASGETNLEEER